MRIGAKKKPFYRVVVLDKRAKRTGAYIELLGTYNPLTEPKDIKLKQDRIDHWVKQGAQLSTGFLRIIGKAPQRPPRKPKKEKKTEKPAEETAKSTESEVTEVKSDEVVIASEATPKAGEAKQSSANENPTQIATGRRGDPRDDKIEESEKNERSA